MLVRHLFYFSVLARERHFARAARVCNVAQSTLSAAVRKLEEDLGARLVVRGHSYAGLTAEGERVLVWSRQILSDWESLRVDMSGLKQGLTGRLKLGVVPATIPAAALLTARFSAAHPAVTVDVQSMTSRAIQRHLDALELDGGMTYLDNEPLENVRRLPLYREHYLFVCCREHPLAGKVSVSWREAAAGDLCLLSEDMQNRRIIDALAGSIGLSVQPRLASNSFLTILAHLRQGGWTSILPHTFRSMFADEEMLVALPIVEPAHTQAIGLVLSDRDPLSPMAAALFECATAFGFAREIEQAFPSA
jgi:DNA-binding transcriptional LysR family regulator